MHKLKKQDLANAIGASVFIVLVVAVGIHWLVSSHAASPFASAEAESGVLGGTTKPTIVTNNSSGASGNSYVQFGALPGSSGGSPDFTAVGTIFDSDNGAGSGMGGVDSLTVSPKHVGDLLVLADQVDLDNGIGDLTGVTGTGTSGWTKLVDITDDGGYVALWAGTITATGSTKLTLEYSGSLSGSDTEYTAQEFEDPNGWALDIAKSQDNTSSSTSIGAPTLTPTSGSAELYVGYAAVLSTGGANSQNGWTYQITASGYQNIYFYNTNVTSATVPTAITQSPAGSSTVLAALIKP